MSMPPVADFELDWLMSAFPQWRVSRLGSLIRAEREGRKTRYAESPALMRVILADAEFSSHPSLSYVTGYRTVMTR